MPTPPRLCLLVLPALLLSACAPEGETMSEAAMASIDCEESHTLCVELLVPDTYEGEPSRLVTAMYDSNDTERPPQGVMPEIESPSVVPGESYLLSHAQIDAAGEYFLMFVLYDVNGGKWIPKAGVDYTATTPQSVIFDGAPIDLGELVLEFAD